MATQAQFEANRKNAQKSTGPKTPEGREAVRLNGLKHGLASDILVLPGESESDFENLLDSLETEHQPATATEVILVRHMAMASWRLQRLVHMEAAHYRLRRDELDVHFKGYYTDLTEPARQAMIATGDPTLINFSRYEARLERTFHKSLTALHRLKAERKSEMTDRSQSQAVPHPTSTAPAAKTAKVEHARPAYNQPATGNRQPATVFQPAPDFP